MKQKSKLIWIQSAKVAELVKQAGFPPGVINIITGFGNVSGSVLSNRT